MPLEYNVIDECISQLVEFSRGAIGSSYMRSRAELIAGILRDYLKNNEIDKAILIIKDQVRLVTMDNESTYVTPNSQLYPSSISCRYTFAHYLEKKDYPYCDILVKALRLLHLSDKIEYQLPGVNLTHRVWVGGQLSDENITKIKGANIALEENWFHSQIPNQRIKLHHYIWTNRKDLLSGLIEIPNTQFKNIDELFDPNDELYQFFLSLMSRKEYAFVSDLARMQACYRYGGMFLGISWAKAYLDPKKVISPHHTKPLFAPNLGSFAIFNFIMPYKYTFFHPFSSSIERQLAHYINEESSYYQRNFVTCDLVDSEIIYFGQPGHYLLTMIIDYQRKCLNTMGKNGVPNVLVNYRKAMQEKLPKQYFAIMRINSNPKKAIRSIAHQKVHDDRRFNLALVTNTVPIRQALADLGYFILDEKTCGRSKEVFTLNRECALDIVYQRKFLTCPKLGICRMASQSWIDIDPSAKISEEL
ncbi:hypothetical protein AAEX28_04510 [Lentisphaerota bacterium WC36G]|nr:hypothetical protein LJT99_07370 [Lentisphaerae bacterium WC36]